MNYITIKLGGKEFKARLTTREAIKCEERLGKNPINVLTDCLDNQLPKIKDMMVIVHQSVIALQHNVKIDELYDLFQEDLDNGEDISKLVIIVTDILKASGLIKYDEPNEAA